MYVQHTVTMQQESVAYNKDGSIQWRVLWMHPYTVKSGCVFGTPAPIHLTPCRALEQ